MWRFHGVGQMVSLKIFQEIERARECVAILMNNEWHGVVIDPMG